MTEPADSRRAKIAELSAAAGILLWRLIVLPLPAVPMDWMTILAIYWAYTVLAHRSKHWPWVTVGTMALLAGIYLQGQFPFTLDVLGIPS